MMAIQITDLDAMSYRQLCETWDLVELPPRQLRVSTDLMKRLIADALQRRSRSDIATEARIHRTLARALMTGPSHPKLRVEPGTALTRDWKGIRHTVQVTGDGFEWQGETYRSLSKIAHLITGTRWSGPRFFGVQV